MLNFHNTISPIALLVMALLAIGCVRRKVQPNKILKMTGKAALVTGAALPEKSRDLMNVATVWDRLATDLIALGVTKSTPKMYQLGLLKTYQDTG